MKLKGVLKRHIALIILLVIIIVFPISLSNQAKLSMRIIVTGLAIDKSENGYEVTAQIVKAAPGAESSGTTASIDFISIEGKTINEALSKLTYKSGKVAAYSHTNFVIIGADVLEEDITKCLDIFVRDKIIRSSALLGFAEDKAKDEIKKTKSLELSVGVGLQKVFLFKEEEGDALMTTILDFLTDSKSYSKTSFASEVKLGTESELEASSNSSSGGSEGGSGEESSSSESSGSSGEESSSSESGSSISSGSSGGGSGSSGGSGGESESTYFKPWSSILFFVDGKYKFKLEESEELFGFLITNKETHTLELILDDFEHESLKDAKVSVQIEGKSTKTKVRFEDETPCLDISVSITNSEIVEVLSGQLITDIDEEVYKDIEEAFKSKICECISKTFEKAKANNADAYRAYELAYKFNYNTLKKYYSSEQEFISQLKLNVDVSIKKLEF